MNYIIYFNSIQIYEYYFIRNIFLTKDATIKIGDFGIARIFDDESTCIAKTYAGTNYYMSPQIKSYNDYNFKTDCWSIGCTVYELFTLNIFYDSIHYQSNEFNLNVELNILNELLDMYIYISFH